MYLKELKLYNFKNFSAKEFAYHPKLNCIIGQNGVGKTNILDAIHHLCLGKSYFNNTHNQNILHGETSFNVTGAYQRKEKEELVSLGYEKNKIRVLKRNNKILPSLSEHLGQFPVVIITPHDTALIDEGNEVRRRFLDRSICQFSRAYFEQLSTYHKLLLQRNKLLKHYATSGHIDHALIAVLNGQMSETATPIYKERETFVKALKPYFNTFYQNISSGREEVELSYSSDLANGNLLDILESHLTQDLRLTYTSKGIHKDTLSLNMGGYPVKKYGSQGQKKTLIIALKLSQYALIKAQSNLSPLLLLDDIFDKLDETRVSKIIALIRSEDFGQSFITDTNYNQPETQLTEAGIDFNMIKL